MQKVRKILPVSLYDLPGLERWLEEQAGLGLFPVSLGSWAVFEPRAVPNTRFRLDPFANRMGEGTQPTSEKLALYRQSGWDYAFSIGQAYFLFYTTDPDAPELYTDYQSQGMSLERLVKRLHVYRWQRIAAFSAAILMFLAALFWSGRFDVQPAPLARLPLILLHLFHPSVLFFLAAFGFYEPIHRRDQRTLTDTYNALSEGLPPPSPGPSAKIVRENLFTLALIPVLTLLLLFNLAGKSGKSFALSEFERPFVSLTELERTPLFVPLEGYLTEENRAVQQFSLLSPVWYEVEQTAYSWEPGRENGYSPDPQDGRYTYSPSLSMTCFHLLVPALARPVAQAQLDFYRAVNLSWTYEETDWPGADFVILAKADDKPFFQMAAVCRGGRLAVYRYSGMENLADHLDALAASLRKTETL